MKKLLGFIFCMTIIPALILAGAVGYIYNNYFKPTPMEYDFLRGESQICSVEYASVSFADGNVTTESIVLIDDIDGFTAELKASDCHKGITLQSFKALSQSSSISGFVINYHDGSFEVITPYVCVNSDLEITEISDLLNADVYGFESEAIFALIEKYGASGGVNI